jgi:acetyl esterase/lipase
MLCFATLIALAALPTAAHAQTTQTLTFAEVGGRPLQLDLRTPDGPAAGPRPLVISIHGGGWSSGRRSFPLFTRGLLEDGYAVAAIEYRLTSQAGQWGDEQVYWPAQIHDCKAAVRWLRANADALGLDPCRFIVWGPSAGGHLAAVLGTSNGNAQLEGDVGEFDGVSSDVQLAVDYFGPTDILFLKPDVTDPPGARNDHDAVDSNPSRLLGSEVHGISVGEIRDRLGDPSEPWASLAALASSASPAQLALDATSNVPMFIAHGQMDDIVPYRQSVRLHDALTAVGAEHVFITEPDAGHSMPLSVAVRVRAWLADRVPALSPCGCAADLDGDGELTVFDFLMFQNLFGVGDPIADFDGDGALTVFDFLAFQNAFDAGCA